MDVNCAYCLIELNSMQEFYINDNTLFLCPFCGSITLAPQNQYNDYPTSYFGSDTKKFSFPFIQRVIDFFQHYKGKQLSKWLNKNVNILDIGCGDGQILTSLAKKKHGNFIGIELENKALQRAKQNNKIEVLSTNIFNYFPNIKFDMIICNHSFEHIHNPLFLIKHVNYLLKNDGVFYINIPNANSFQFHFFRSKWLHLDPPYHLHIPNISKFSLILEDNGFIIKKINHFNFIQNISSFILSFGNFFFKLFNKLFNILKNPYPIYKNILYIIILLILAVLLILPATLEYIISGFLKKGATVEIIAQKINDI
jgi:SAM-dependent methyltransferase